MSPRTFRVGTFNLYNLALPNVFFNDRSQYTPEEYSLKKTWVASQLLRMRADLIGFQEVFHQRALREALAASEMHKTYQVLVADPTGSSLIETTTPKIPFVALATRFPIVKHQVIEAFPAEALLDVQGVTVPLTKFSRPVLYAQLKLRHDIECSVFVVHLKSKRPILPNDVDRNDPVEKAKGQARSLILRAAEATALRMILMETLQGRDHPVIVMGDVNDGGLAVTSQIISGEPPWRQLPPDRKKALWDVLLYHVRDIQARMSYRDYYYTHIHNGHYEGLDHIMVSQEFAAQNPERIGRVCYVSLFNDHLIDSTLSRESVASWQSDHGQVVAAIEFRE
jgi:endonuclease/exonuclease/phosphatase family metal-dependent hydrolase